MTLDAPQEESFVIAPFNTTHAAAFRDLNLAWITRYFGVVESKDRETLDAPKEKIIDRGGMILMAEDHTGTAIGCVALLRTDGHELELAKMAVKDGFQGRGVGRLLMNAGIAAARQLGAKSLYLESNDSLTPAMRLYESSGFRHVPVEERPASPYARCNAYMRLKL